MAAAMVVMVAPTNVPNTAFMPGALPQRLSFAKQIRN